MPQLQVACIASSHRLLENNKTNMAVALHKTKTGIGSFDLVVDQQVCIFPIFLREILKVVVTP